MPRFLHVPSRCLYKTPCGLAYQVSNRLWWQFTFYMAIWKRLCSLVGSYRASIQGMLPITGEAGYDPKFFHKEAHRPTVKTKAFLRKESIEGLHNNRKQNSACTQSLQTLVISTVTHTDQNRLHVPNWWNGGRSNPNRQHQTFPTLSFCRLNGYYRPFVKCLGVINAS